jgi:hypothetical protein
MLMSEPLPSRAKELQAMSRSKLKTLNAELNPNYHLLALLGAHRILHVGRIRVKVAVGLLTVHTTLSPHTHTFKLKLTEWQD